MSVPRDVHTKVETGSSAIPAAILESVFAVQGAIKTASTRLEVTSSTCSTLPVIFVIGAFPVDHSKIMGDTSSAASSVRSGNTSAPWRMRASRDPGSFRDGNARCHAESYFLSASSFPQIR